MNKLLSRKVQNTINSINSIPRQQYSSMYVNDITCLDFVILCDNGNALPYSCRVGVEVLGKLDSHEQVVVDFSLFKKKLKEILDDYQLGFDHKFLVKRDKVLNNQEGNYLIFANGVSYNLPLNAICFLTNQLPIDQDDILSCLAKFIQPSLQLSVNLFFNDVVIKELVLTTDRIMYNVDNVIPFNYTHGLRYSTSTGCQNIAHGHLSFIGFQYHEGLEKHYPKTIEEDFNGLNVFIWKNNIVEETGEYLTIGYETDRGKFKATYKKEEIHNLIIMDNETSIENIAHFLKDRYNSYLKQCNIKKIYVSEGLQKGSFFEID